MHQVQLNRHPYQHCLGLAISLAIAVNLGSRVSAKIKVKISANENIDFGALLSVAPPREKFALSTVSSGGAVNQPQLTLEPYHTPKKVTNVNKQHKNHPLALITIQNIVLD